MTNTPLSISDLKGMLEDASEEITDNCTLLRNIYSDYEGLDHNNEVKRLIEKNDYLRQLESLLIKKLGERGANGK